jgi:hypothetical protein
MMRVQSAAERGSLYGRDAWDAWWERAAEGKERPEKPSATLPKLECQPFGHHEDLMLVFRNEQDFQQACERMSERKVQITYPGGRTKVGLGRVIDGARAMRVMTEGKA